MFANRELFVQASVVEDENDLKSKKIKMLIQTIQSQEKKIVSLKNIILNLKEHNLINKDISTLLLNSFDDNVDNDSIHHSTNKIGDTSETYKSAVRSVKPENNVHIKNEIEELEVKDEIKEDPEILYHSIEAPVEVQLPKVAIPRLIVTNTNVEVKNPSVRLGRRFRPILPRPQPSTSHQIFMPSAKMPRIAYQIGLGNHSENSNNSFHCAMLQPKPVFFQQTPTSTPSPMVISQPSMVMNQHYQIRERNIPPPEFLKIAPKIDHPVTTNCSFCSKHFQNLVDHIIDCRLNPDSKGMVHLFDVCHNKENN